VGFFHGRIVLDSGVMTIDWTTVVPPENPTIEADWVAMIASGGPFSDPVWSQMSDQERALARIAFGVGHSEGMVYGGDLAGKAFEEAMDKR
jgi:hypothetical protein